MNKKEYIAPKTEMLVLGNQSFFATSASDPANGLPKGSNYDEIVKDDDSYVWGE